MALSIHHPKKNGQVLDHADFVLQGSSQKNSARIVYFLTKKGSSISIPPAAVLIKKKSAYGLVFRNVPDGEYQLVVHEGNAPPVIRKFKVKAKPPKFNSPNVRYPTTNSAVNAIFSPYGYSVALPIASIVFYDAAGNSVNGVIAPPPVPNPTGFWTGVVDTTTNPNLARRGDALDVTDQSNPNPTTTVSGLSF